MNFRRRWFLILLTPLLALIAYGTVAVVVFDFSETAFPYDEDNYRGREVAIGPRPRQFFCPPTWEGVRWEGREWPFVVFAPICGWWRERHGYAPPADWRRSGYALQPNPALQ